ncbi:MAG: intein-containing RctB family protein [Candidatus Omnitrophota bacterium]
MTQPFTGKLERIDDYRWRIPKSYDAGMRVDGIIFSDKKMIEHIVRDNAPQQIANAAHLPGIVKASMAMPDIHWGYGLPIGGVVATDIEAGGVITPGGVGYDINCLSGDSRILLSNGAYVEIKDFEDVFMEKELSCFDLSNGHLARTTILRFLKIRPSDRVYKVTTLNGKKITATGDHPFWTPDGMVPLRMLSPEDIVAVYPFEGVAYEDPGDGVIINEDDIRDLLVKNEKDSRGHGVEQIINHLKKRDLLPLRYNSPQLPYILKIMGYNFGDGNIYFNEKKGKGCVSFYGKQADLEKIRNDVAKTGFACSRVYSRIRDHEINTAYSNRKFTAENHFCKVSSSGLAALLAALGTPVGNKTRQTFRIPAWIRKAPLWQKRLFLAAFFGAEMSTPQTMTGHGYNFYSPAVSVNKDPGLAADGREFLKDISDMLGEFGVAVNRAGERVESKNSKGEVSVRLRLSVSSKTGNLIRLYSRVGFEYNAERTMLSNAAIQYLSMKEMVIEERADIENKVREMATAGMGAGAIYENMRGRAVNQRFIERSIYGPRKTGPRLASGAITFREFLEHYTRGMGTSGMIWDRISDIEQVDFDGYVYDFTVEHTSHNFIANGFVVSNCGVRLVRTDLRAEDVKPRIRELVDALYSSVPTGVGSTGDVRVSAAEEKKIMLKGARWAVEKGFGWEGDLLHCEENGAIEGADPEMVSKRAYERGRSQSGTLGSGNHFLEVQVVEEVYRRDIAEVFGISEGQITVMVHTGSRGFGHQICTDYAEGMIGSMGKFNIRVPDRQLACVPVKSDEGREYLGAMRSAANYAWANRQVITHLARKVFERVFGDSAVSLGMRLVYDVAHNIAKFEKYEINGKERLLCIHRKGATRAFPPGHREIPEDYRATGQPVIIPGDMGRYSYLLAGCESAEETFYSTCHGAGRFLSRHAAKRLTRGRSIRRELEDRGIIVRYTGRDTLGEEASEAYKDVMDVVNIVCGAGLSVKVAKMRPIGVIKG